MASMPPSSPDYDTPHPSGVPTELPPMPGDIDDPAPMGDPMPEMPIMPAD